MIGRNDIDAEVKRFFQQFLLKIVCSDVQNVTLDDMEPRQVKMTVASHIEEVAPAFNEHMFYRMLVLNYNSGEAEELLRNHVALYSCEHEGKQPGYMELLPFACRTEECYAMLIECYKKYLFMMMEGRVG